MGGSVLSDGPDSDAPVEAPLYTYAGVRDVKRAVASARRVFVVVDPDASVPCRVSKRDARRMLSSIERQRRGVVVTVRVRGDDAVIRTLQWLGDSTRMVAPMPTAGDASPARGPASGPPLSSSSVSRLGDPE